MPGQDPFLSDECEVDVNAETSAAIERGICAADEGRTVPASEVPELIAQWISKLATPGQR